MEYWCLPLSSPWKPLWREFRAATSCFHPELYVITSFLKEKHRFFPSIQQKILQRNFLWVATYWHLLWKMGHVSVQSPLLTQTSFWPGLKTQYRSAVEKKKKVKKTQTNKNKNQNQQQTMLHNLLVGIPWEKGDNKLFIVNHSVCPGRQPFIV